MQKAPSIVRNRPVLRNYPNCLEPRTIKGYHVLGWSRLSLDEYFLNMAEVVSTRSTCISRINGAVIVDASHYVLATGYNGWPSGKRNCIEEFSMPGDPCERLRKGSKTGDGYTEDLCMAVHAEKNAIEQAKKRNISLEGATLYLFSESTKLEGATHYKYGLCDGCTEASLDAGIIRAVIESVINRGYSMNDTKVWEFDRKQLKANLKKMRKK